MELPAVLLEDNFNAEHGSQHRLNYIGFAHWEVVDGTVDLIGTAPFDDFLPRSYGMYLDLDGTSRNAGRLQSRSTFALSRGTYTLTFDLAGMPRDMEANTVVVSLGSLFSEQITLASYTPIVTFTRIIRVTSPTTAKLVFDHQGGDDFGLLLDNVRLVRN